MKFQSVRLTHAQSVPGHYFSNQIYQPVDDDQLARGSFIILFEAGKSVEGTFVASLINTLIREFYRHTTADRLTAFEQTLVRLNDLIRQHYNSSDLEQWRLDGVIILVAGDEIHVTGIGESSVWLARNNGLIPLLDNSSENADSENFTPSFSVITSGEVNTDDNLIVTTRTDDRETQEKDLLFSLQHTPLYESGRAYARLLKEALIRNLEAIFVNFNDATEGKNEQIYLDKALETSGEKLAHYQQIAAKQLKFVAGGGQFIAHNLGKIKFKKGAKPIPPPAGKITEPIIKFDDEESEPISKEPPPLERVIPSLGSDSGVNSAKESINSPGSSETAIAEKAGEANDYAVHTYRQSTSPVTIPVESPETIDEEATLPRRSSVSLIDRVMSIRPTTWYWLLGGILVIILVINVGNALVNHVPGAATVSNAQRDKLITAAQAAISAAEADVVQKKTSDAITQYLTARDDLAKIGPSDQTDATKALVKQVDEELASVSQTTALTTATNVSSTQNLSKIVSTGDKSYIIGGDDKNQTLIQFYNGSLSAVSGLPSKMQIIDIASYNSGKDLAVYLQPSSGDRAMYSVNTATGGTTLLKTDNGKAWPVATSISGYSSNIYFIGSTMYKATTSDGTTYHVTSYGVSLTTDTTTSAVVNNGEFYAIDGGNSVVRFDAKNAKTTIQINGAPTQFLPSKIAKLISPIDGTLYLFDTVGQRLVQITTDGAYQAQDTLPTETKFVDCGLNGKNLTCVTADKKVETFVTP